jgi:hypothetical protein
MNTNKQRIIVGGTMALVFLPVILLGFVTSWIARYFRSGYEIADLCNDELDKWLEKFDEEPEYEH